VRGFVFSQVRPGLGHNGAIKGGIEHAPGAAGDPFPADLLQRSGLSGEEVDDVLASDAYGALSAELRLAEANHHDLDTPAPATGRRSRPRGRRRRRSDHPHPPGAATARPAGSGRTRRPPQLIAGLIPRAAGPMTKEMRQALDEREALIELRADAVLDTALTERAPWASRLGSPPTDPADLRARRPQARVVAAYGTATRSPTRSH
jgi:hypothetical protein